MSNRTDFGLMHLGSPPHCLSSSIWEEKITFLARLQSFLCCPVTSFPPHLQQEALIWVCLPPSYWQALHRQAPPISFAAFAFGQNWPMSSRVTAEKLTDGQTDGMHKKTYSRYFYFFFTSLLHSITSLLSYHVFCPKNTGAAFSAVLPSAPSPSSYYTSHIPELFWDIKSFSIRISSITLPYYCCSTAM